MKQILLFLNSSVSAFSITELQLDILNDNLGNYKLITVDSIDNFVANLKNSDIVITWIFKKGWYGKAKKLTHIFTPAAGNEWIAPSPNNNIKIIFGKFHGKLMGESLLSMMLYFNRDISQLVKNSSSKIWDRDTQRNTKSLFEQSVMILGYGNIGRIFAKILKPFNLTIYGVQRKKKDEIDQETGVNFITKKDINNLLPNIDHLISILPASPETDNFLKYNHFKLLKNSAIFYNTGRGNCCNDSDIIKAIDNCEIAGAALDVFNYEPLDRNSDLWANEKILISPHSSCIFKDYLDYYFKEIIPIINML